MENVMKEDFEKELEFQEAQRVSVQSQTALKVFDHFMVDIAIMGESGVGKSSLVNVLLGFSPECEEGAPTGVVETTMTPTMYPHPKHPYVRLWDLPGMGTPSFKSKNYIKKMNMDLYDLFVIVFSDRTKENCMYLVDEILRRHRPFYLVRSKVDNDLLSESRKCDFTAPSVLNRMRRDCLFHLQAKVKDPRVFLVSTHGANEYDLQQLMETLEGDLPLLRKKAFGDFLEDVSQRPYTLFKCIKLPAVKREKIRRGDVEQIRAVFRPWDLSNRSARETILNHFVALESTRIV
ncbi:interferon-inducible GTPase 5-like [Osmerus mordax]|uniref:interferon-inducible GTPase 5-like n=1 Tax=Osmerus mordax TaxID=8014 RepID=UPI00351008C8